MLLAKGFLILFFCLVVKNNLCGNSSSLMYFIVIFNVFSILFFAADLILLSFVFVNLTHNLHLKRYQYYLVFFNSQKNSIVELLLDQRLIFLSTQVNCY